MPDFFPKLFRKKVEKELASMDSLGLKYPESWKKHSGWGQ